MIQEVAKTFDGPVDLEWTALHVNAAMFTTALIRFDVVPITSENLQITFMSANGDAYNTIIYSVDPSTDSLTNIAYSPNVAIPMNKGDRIRVTYTNTDGNSVRITLKGFDSSNF